MTKLMTSTVFKMNDSVESIREGVVKYYPDMLVIIGAIKIIKLRSLIRTLFYTERVNFLSVKHKMFLLSQSQTRSTFFHRCFITIRCFLIVVSLLK